MSKSAAILPNLADWPVFELTEVTSMVRRGTAPVYVDSSDIHAIGQRCVTRTDFDESLTRPHSSRAVAKVVRPQVDDVLLNSTGTGTIGRSVVFPSTNRQFIVDGHVTVIRPQPSKSTGEWINEQLRSPWGQAYLESHCYTGSTNQIELSASALASSQIAVPSYSEQRRIAEILGTLDDQIRTTAQIIAKLRITKHGLLTDLFTHGIEQDGRVRDPVASPDDFKPSGSGLMPKSWREDSVGDLISSGDLTDIQDGNHGELHPKRNEFVLEGIPFLMARDISGGEIDFDHCYRIRREQYARLRVGFSKPGDVLLSHKGTIGEVAIVPEDAREVMLTPQVTYYRPARGLSSEFLYYCMQTGEFQRALRIIAGQSTRDYVGISAQRRLLYIPVPDASEQDRIVSIARAIDSRLKNEKVQLAKLRLTRVGLTTDLLTGRVRVPVEGVL